MCVGLPASGCPSVAPGLYLPPSTATGAGPGVLPLDARPGGSSLPENSDLQNPKPEWGPAVCLTLPKAVRREEGASAGSRPLNELLPLKNAPQIFSTFSCPPPFPWTQVCSLNSCQELPIPSHAQGPLGVLGGDCAFHRGLTLGQS